MAIVRSASGGVDLNAAYLEAKRVHAEDLQRIRQWAKEFPTILAPTDLSSAFFDTATVLSVALLLNVEQGAVCLADVRWGGVNLAVISDRTTFNERGVELGDKREAWAWKPEPFNEMPKKRKRPRRELESNLMSH